MVTRVDKYLGGLGIDATGKFEIASNATITVGDGLSTGNVVSGTIYSNGVELRANDYSTYITLLSAYSANDGVTLASARSNDYTTYTTLTANYSANDYTTYTTLTANDGVTLTSAYSNDATTLLSARSNDYSTYTTLTANYSANDGVTLASARSNDYTTYTTLSNSINAITNNPVTFQSDVTIRGNLYLTGSNTLLVSNTVSLGDSLLSLAANNTLNDAIDIGVYGHYWNGTANSHAGLVRSAVSKDWMLFGNYTIDLEGNNTVNIASPSFGYANLRLNIANAISVYSNGVELRANDYTTYSTLTTNYSANDGVTLTSAYSNDGSTLLSARSNDYTTYTTLVANDSATLLSARSNDYTTYTTLVANDSATLLSARSNDYTTYTTLTTNYSANDGVTLTSARSNDYSTYSTLDSAKANKASPTFSGTVTLGSNTNVILTGGSANSSIRTDGSGNLSWTSPLQPRVLTSTANSGTPSLNTDLYDMMVITGQSVAITSFTTTGTPVNGQKLWLAITGTGAIALTGISGGANFEASTVALPTTTVTTNRLDIGFVYNSTTSKWRCVASA